MLIYANICKLSKSSHLVQAVVSAYPVLTRIQTTDTCALCTIGNRVNTYIKQFLNNGSMKLHAKLYTDSRPDCFYPHQVELLQVQYSPRYLRNKKYPMSQG